jgi:hypothetical protein
MNGTLEPTNGGNRAGAHHPTEHLSHSFLAGEFAFSFAVVFAVSQAPEINR